MITKQLLQAARAATHSWLPDALMTAGAVAVSVGAGMVYRPAGWIVAGIFSLVAGVILAKVVR
jgi:uncharacterized protein YjeT (DUF2065 family)